MHDAKSDKTQILKAVSLQIRFFNFFGFSFSGNFC